MKRFDATRVGVCQGSHMLFSDFIDDGPMWTGTGPREHRREVAFEDAFSDPPAVHVSMSMWDSDSGSNQRMDIAAEKITEKGFELVFRTWGDSRVARVRAAWMAVGPMAHDDDWNLY